MDLEPINSSTLSWPRYEDCSFVASTIYHKVTSVLHQFKQPLSSVPKVAVVAERFNCMTNYADLRARVLPPWPLDSMDNTLLDMHN